jgi:aminobenzoyl-glutamate utilization protein B
VVPDFAESYFYVRHADPRVTEQIFDRLVKTGEGAALGTPRSASSASRACAWALP